MQNTTYSGRKKCTRRHGCTHVLNTGTFWTILLFVPATTKMSALHEQCAEQLHFQQIIACMVRSIMNICLARKYRKHKKTNKNKYNIKSYQDPCTRTKLHESLSVCLADHPSADVDVDQQWDAPKSAIHKACIETIGHTVRMHQDWFDENYVVIQNLFGWKRNTFCLNLAT